MLVHWPINSEAPFEFDLSFVDELYSRETLSDEQLLVKCRAFKPELILSSGWMDRGYVKVCRLLYNDAITILSLDNHWHGSFKQLVARLLSPFTLKRSFKKAFVPGQIQKYYALKLGFKENDILTGFYSADTRKFDDFYSEIMEVKQSIPRKFLYLGRYTKHKGIFDLWEAFLMIKKKYPEWELWCVGTGDEFQNRVEAEGIKHFGFKQPSELLPILKETGVYVLPSHFEPWGVSVQEMAIAGFPLLLSDKIGSKEAYLEEGENGFEFANRNPEDLFQTMSRMINLIELRGAEMMRISHQKGAIQSPQKWADSLLSFLN